MANFAAISGILKDTDGTAWHLATWTAVPVSPSSKPVFKDGTPVPTTSGTLDDTGAFSGQIPNTLAILPPGTTLTITLTSMTSAPPLTLTKVQIVADTVDLGALLTPRTVAPRIKAGAIVYAYNTGEITNPVHGNGYVNTYENASYIYMQNSWVKIGASPNFDKLTANDLTVDGAITSTGNLDVGGTGTFGGNLTLTGSNGTITGVNSLILDAGGTNGVYISWFTGTLGTHFGDGKGNLVGLIDAAGNASFNGTLSAGGAKTFRIPHPLDPAKNLIHACLEGPENGVYYRGEAELSGGFAEVELPDYFEALTASDGRTVLLTQVDDGGELALLAASRVVAGKFSIRSSVKRALVTWEVKAERRSGVERLIVERDKGDDDLPQASNPIVPSVN